MSTYAELAVTTNFSFLRGASHPQELVARADELGLIAIGIADRNSFAGAVRAYDEARKRKIKLLVGTRLVTIDGFEVLAYPIDRAAYGRLCRLITAGNLKAKKSECHLTFGEILNVTEGQIFIMLPPAVLFCGSNSISARPRASRDPLDRGNERRECPAASSLFQSRLCALADIAPGRTFLAGVHYHHGDEPRRLGFLAEFGAQCGAPLVAVNDVFYHLPERRPLLDMLTCIREKCTIAAAGLRLSINAERHLKAPEEMARLFAAFPDAVARSLAIARSCSFSLGERKYEYPDEPVPPGKTAQQHLADLAWAGAQDGYPKDKYPNGIPGDVRKRLEDELALIGKLDYARYFLTVHDVVSFARCQEKEILCQGRGSAANSAVCFCLGITSVNPDKSNLLFARFISENRGEPPDIDVDFEHERREEVIQYIYERYGRERAGIAATVISYRTRSAIREVGKAFGLSEDTIGALATGIWGSGTDGPSPKDLARVGLDRDSPRVRRMMSLIDEIMSFPRHLSQHVGGFVITRGRLDEVVPVANAAMDERTFVEWDKDDLDALGILKVDVLGLGMLTCVRKALALIEKHYGERLTLSSIPPDDPAVYRMLSRADSIGVFQVESRAQMSMLPRLKPSCFYDLVIEVAIVRPGPIQGDMVHPYLRRRSRKETISYRSEALRQVLSKTLGVPLFQEQAMKIAIVGAGFTPEDADRLRRAMATFKRNGDIHLFRDKFIAGMVKNGYDRDFATRCFSQIEGFGTYGFPESHAASFALLVYISSWIKCFYPDVFACALLNSQPMGFYAPAQIVRDAREHDVEVRPVDINHSLWDCTLEPSGGGKWAVRLGFPQIKGFAEADANQLVASRPASGYPDPRTLWRRSGLGLAALERLAEADAFRSIGLDRRRALWALKALGEPPLPLFATAEDATV